MPRVLFATGGEHPGLTVDDRLAADALGKLGIDVAPVVWSDTDPASLRGADALVIRSCWDYHLHPAEFHGWIDELERAGIRVINPLELLRWNLHKRYLRDLQAGGIEIVPTVWVEQGAGASLSSLLQESRWGDAVVKPAVSLSAYETWRVSAAEAANAEARFAALSSAGDVLVQRFVPEITTGGEWSLVFFGSEYSHSVRKRPRSGDFRVQVDHGGTVTPDVPPPGVLAGVHAVIAALAWPPAYARVDGVEVDGRLVLMELECIDPVLYLSSRPRAAGRFARQIAPGAARLVGVPAEQAASRPDERWRPRDRELLDETDRSR